MFLLSSWLFSLCFLHPSLVGKMEKPCLARALPPSPPRPLVEKPITMCRLPSEPQSRTHSLIITDPEREKKNSGLWARVSEGELVGR
ncbi:hypothetical protein V8C37DRAFT_375366 [Trichoderma ceciliae]